jgi:hypothetical protein
VSALDWSQTLSATSASSGSDGSATVNFEQGDPKQSANDRIFLQGDRKLISEPGEWALDSATQTLYYWPRCELNFITTLVIDHHASRVEMFLNVLMIRC